MAFLEYKNKSIFFFAVLLNSTALLFSLLGTPNKCATHGEHITQPAIDTSITPNSKQVVSRNYSTVRFPPSTNKSTTKSTIKEAARLKAGYSSIWCCLPSLPLPICVWYSVSVSLAFESKQCSANKGSPYKVWLNAAQAQRAALLVLAHQYADRTTYFMPEVKIFQNQ